MPIDKQKFAANLNGEASAPQQSAEAPQQSAIVRRLDAPAAAQLPTLFQAELIDTAAVDEVTEQNWEVLDLGFDALEEQLIEQFRQRGRATAAKARAAYSAELANGLGKSQGGGCSPDQQSA